LYKLALPFASVVGPGAPAKDANRIPLIGTGPYVFDGSAPKDHVVLRRSQRFREWSHVARPDGYPDVIDLLLIDGDQAPRYVTATVAGAFDFASGLLTPPQIAMLRTTQPTQLHPF